MKLVLFLCAQDNQGVFSASTMQRECPAPEGEDWLLPGAGVTGAEVAPRAGWVLGQGLASQGSPTTPARSRAAGGAPGAAPALGIGHLPGDGPRLGQDLSPGSAWPKQQLAG